MKGIGKFIENIESESLKRAFLTLFSWMFLRIFVEGVFEASHRIGYLAFSYKALVIYFVHYPAFYLSLFLVITLITALITKIDIRKVTSVYSYGFGLILLVPLIDWMIGGGYTITYPLRIEPYLVSSLNPFTSIIEYGGSPGQRIIFFFICLLITLYAICKTRKILISITLFFISYCIIILLGGLPTIIAGNKPESLFITGGILYSDTQKFASIFLLLLVFAIVVYLFLMEKKKFKLIMNSLRLERAAFYGGIGIFGLLLALHQQTVTVQQSLPFVFDRIGILVLWLTLALGFQGAAAINDFFDIESDNLTRSRNPLTQGLDKNYYLYWTAFIICLALGLSLLLNYVSFLIMSALIFLSILYSVPPVRLKRIPIVSSFILAVATVFSMTLGFSLLTGNRALNLMPSTILIPTLIGITLGFCAKDIRDVKGDRTSHVITIPVFFSRLHGPWSRLPIALIIGSSYLIYAIFIKQLFIGSLVASIVTILYIMVTKKVHEWFYFLLLYGYGGYLIYMLDKLPVLM